jgi:multidrug efflux pump subunit AcrB
MGLRLIHFLSSPNRKFDNLYLSNYASIKLRDELACAAGLSEVSLVGSLGYRLRIRLDPHHLVNGVEPGRRERLARPR